MAASVSALVVVTVSELSAAAVVVVSEAVVDSSADVPVAASVTVAAGCCGMGRLERSPTLPQAVIEAAAINMRVIFDILFIFILLCTEAYLRGLKLS